MARPAIDKEELGVESGIRQCNRRDRGGTRPRSAAAGHVGSLQVRGQDSQALCKCDQRAAVIQD